MGLGLQIFSEIKPVGLLRRKPDPVKFLEEIGRTLKAIVARDGFTLAYPEIFNGELSLQIYPVEEAVFFSVNERGQLVCSAKTSGAGPGYHAYLIEKLDELEKRCHLKWIWDNREDFFDETGYALDREYPKLQAKMEDFLGGLAKLVVQKSEEGNSNLCLNFPLGMEVQIENTAASPKGMWDKSFFEEIAAKRGDHQALVPYAERFFAWWRKEQDASFWKNLGLCLFWMEVPWRPVTENEQSLRKTMEYAIECFMKAKKLDPSIEIPWTEINELKEILIYKFGKSTEPLPVPVPGRIGYFRLLKHRPLTGGWKVSAPGYFYEEFEDDTSSQVYWYGGRVIRGSSFTINYDNKKESPADEMIKKERRENKIIAEFQKERLVGIAYEKYITAENSESGQPYYILFCIAGFEGELCNLSICYDDQSDQPWAIEVFKSLTHPAMHDKQEQ